MFDRKFLMNAFLTFLLGAIMFYLYNLAVSRQQELTLQNQMDSLLLALNDQLKSTSDIALASSLLLANNPDVIQCFKTTRHDTCYETMRKIKEHMNQNEIFARSGIHLHTKDYKSLVRLFDDLIPGGDNLVSFRQSLKIAGTTQKPVQGIEVGRYGMLERAIVPVFEDNQYLGTIETVIFPERYQPFFKNRGIDFYILMKNEFLDISSKAGFSADQILKHYTLINQKVNPFRFLDDYEFNGTGYFKHGNRLILYTPIIDLNGVEIGHYLLLWEEPLSAMCNQNCGNVNVLLPQ